MRNAKPLLFAALLGALGISGCAEEKVDPRLERAVLNQNQGMRERDARERGGQPTAPPTNQPPK